MIIFPAVDLKDGKAVRLKRGRANQVTVFSDDPVSMALHWESEGARFLHLVDLDGAFNGEKVSDNVPIVRDICRTVTVPVQLGGGIRSQETAKAWIEAGVTRLIIGTMALEDPKSFAALCRTYPGRIGVSMDAENGRLKTRGWVDDSNLTVDDVLPRLAADGAAFIIYTDISRDGMKTGVNLETLETLAVKSSVPIIAAGGVSDMNDIKFLYDLSTRANIEGAITGRAIYEGGLSVREAVEWLDAQETARTTNRKEI